jgi:hypothetical protein
MAAGRWGAAGQAAGWFTGGTAGLGGETRKRLRVLQMPHGAFGRLAVRLAGRGLAPWPHREQDHV